jgi:uncharacterized protein (TIGR00369 family)
MGVNMPHKEKIRRQLTDHCFGCGEKNPIGLRLRFRSEGSTVRTEFAATDLYEGYPGYLHGGILCAILDEAMGWAAYRLSGGTLGVTAKVHVRFRRPAHVGQPLSVSASITRKTKRRIWTRAAISRKDGTVVAEGSATMVVGEQK